MNTMIPSWALAQTRVPSVACSLGFVRPLGAAVSSDVLMHNSTSTPIHAARVRTAVVPATVANAAAVAGADAYEGRKQGSPPRGEPS